MIYISDFDLFNGEKTIYHVDKVIRENTTALKKFM